MASRTVWKGFIQFSMVSVPVQAYTATASGGSGGKVVLNQLHRYTPLQTSFGADVVSWARVVPVESGSPLRAVVAPIDDRWTVVGVLAPTGSR